MSRFEAAAIRIAILLAFVVGAWSVYNKPAPTPEQLRAKEDAQLREETDSYVQAEAECLVGYRPGSEARADCVWKAKREYTRGYLLSLKNSLDAAREQHYNGNTN
ncbi:hypothetical protein [Xanthomonas translucens]|uniref:hypothetical protein n=1 Tax=Xanthomonas campestris pv. translucens TaxID=343 RepID=UPI000AC49DA5|nr:hypothetical protein [Xanthomonas translucens]